MNIHSPDNVRPNNSAMLPDPKDRFGGYKKQAIENRLGSS